jgi:uncharacterized protein
MKFEWDENKNTKNIAKHGIDFNDALTIFDDDERLEAVDVRNDYGEERIQVIGEAKPGGINGRLYLAAQCNHSPTNFR